MMAHDKFLFLVIALSREYALWRWLCHLILIYWVPFHKADVTLPALNYHGGVISRILVAMVITFTRRYVCFTNLCYLCINNLSGMV